MSGCWTSESDRFFTLVRRLLSSKQAARHFLLFNYSHSFINGYKSFISNYDLFAPSVELLFLLHELICVQCAQTALTKRALYRCTTIMYRTSRLLNAHIAVTLRQHATVISVWWLTPPRSVPSLPHEWACQQARHTLLVKNNKSQKACLKRKEFFLLFSFKHTDA